MESDSYSQQTIPDLIILESTFSTHPSSPYAIAESQTEAGRAQAKSSKWANWMDHALVRQVLASDPIGCGRGRTAAKWAEVATFLQGLQPQPIIRTPESCRQRVKKLVEIYKV